MSFDRHAGMTEALLSIRAAPESQVHEHNHAVQFYDDEAFLSSVVAEFLAVGLRKIDRARSAASLTRRRR